MFCLIAVQPQKKSLPAYCRGFDKFFDKFSFIRFLRDYSDCNFDEYEYYCTNNVKNFVQGGIKKLIPTVKYVIPITRVINKGTTKRIITGKM